MNSLVEHIDVENIDFSFLEDEELMSWKDLSQEDQDKIGINAYPSF